jgi:hypothetical protein
MATLSSLLSSLTPGTSGSAPTFFRVYHTNTQSVSNGGCCCLWTVPSGITSITFTVFGGGGSGNAACCCAYQAYGGHSGVTSVRTIDTVAGQQYRICAGGSGACSYQTSNCGCFGCPSYVYGVTESANIICSTGGEPGNSQPGFTGPFSSYTCCWGRISSGNNTSAASGANGDYFITGTGQGSQKNTYCSTHYYYYTQGGPGSSGGRSYTLCDTTWYGNGRQKHNGDGYRNQYPGGPGFGSIACGGTHDYGTGGAGGLVIVSYQ